MGDWTLFSNHGHVLVCLARNNEARLRDVANDVGITERAVQKIVRELQQADYISVSKHGRCNHYHINNRKPLRHPLEEQCSVGRLLQLITQENKPAASKEEKPQAKRARPPAAPRQESAPQVEKEPAPPVEKEPAPPVEKESAPPVEKESPPKAEKKESGKPKQESEPPDDRQQGSLF